MERHVEMLAGPCHRHAAPGPAASAAPAGQWGLRSPPLLAGEEFTSSLTGAAHLAPAGLPRASRSKHTVIWHQRTSLMGCLQQQLLSWLTQDPTPTTTTTTTLRV